MKKFIIVITAIFLAGNLNAKDSLEVYGYSKLSNGTKVFLQNRQWQTANIDSTILKNGKYYFKVEKNQPFYGAIAYENIPGYIPIIFGFEKKIVIIDTLKQYSINESQQNKLLSKFGDELKATKIKSNEAIANSLKYDTEDSTLARKFYAKYLSFQIDMKAIIKKDIKINQASFASLVLLYDYQSIFTKKELYELIKPLKQQFDKYSLYADLLNYAKSDISFSVGKKVNNYCWYDSNKNYICIDTLKSLKSYTLLEFWATWCKPCIQTSKEIYMIDSSYFKKGLTTIRISIDEKDNFIKWKNYITQAPETIIELIDFDGWNSEFLKLIGIKSIPFFLLLDSRRQIISIGSGSDDIKMIKDKLQKLL